MLPVEESKVNLTVQNEQPVPTNASSEDLHAMRADIADIKRDFRDVRDALLGDVRSQSVGLIARVQSLENDAKAGKRLGWTALGAFVVVIVREAWVLFHRVPPSN